MRHGGTASAAGSVYRRWSQLCICDPALECFSNTWAFRRYTREDWHHSGKCCIQTVVCPRLTVTLTSHILAVHGNGQRLVFVRVQPGVSRGGSAACARARASEDGSARFPSVFVFRLLPTSYSLVALERLQQPSRFSVGRAHFPTNVAKDISLSFCARPFNLHQMRLVLKYRYSSPK